MLFKVHSTLSRSNHLEHAALDDISNVMSLILFLIYIFLIKNNTDTDYYMTCNSDNSKFTMKTL